MYIAKLTVYKSVPLVEIIREITFKKGANFIVDARTTEYSRGNGIGKTTALRVIDLCMGAKGRKYLYTDEELSLVNEGLKDFIDNGKLYAELILQDSLTNPKISHTLCVELFTRGTRSIDGEKYNEKDYRTELNKILFDNNFDKPKFRELIGMFVRVNLKDDNNKFLKYLDNYSSNAEYDNIYSFLFRLGDQALNDAILEARRRLGSLDTSILQLFAMNRIKDISSVEQEVVEFDKEIRIVKQNLDNIIDTDALKKNEAEIGYVRTKYSEFSENLSRYGYRLQKAAETLRNAEQEKEMPIDQTVLKGIYDDTRLNTDNLSRTFQDLIDFNKQLIDNKISFFTRQVDKITKKIDQLSLQREELLHAHEDTVMMIKNKDVQGYVSLQARLEDLIREQAKLQKVIEIYEDLSSQYEDTKLELDRLSKSNEYDPRANISQFNSFFTKYSQDINNESFMLYRNTSNFPLAIKNRSSGVSTGTKKSAIAGFDLAYQSYATKENIKHPHFVVHDLIENMDSAGLSAAVKIANSIDCQYIVAVLKEKIDNAQNVDQTVDVRMRLTQEDKFFKFKSKDEK
ncbi:hypothetical protein A2707_00185 [Candidatus Saccharibacteria bacterium RIFCSPHIGHO2_01_FULL_45_15]|nr:MAG: hypothetical protein A2707_00185 [Candidatus Saccharibacteria bacterium RIFCSPHIGHO2_01_FULL_45_15]OGL28536.1 MAG: hypothetical protein A3C39_03745 [Candidatus Saccharibacteria bacterium RIFCSPHIGHO2_02_FULL_46_12]OGL32251.1 MAG: hypothetical protein A3E76_06355 [Candidatus Saccharibacteria bacterium RIFCSPHIGHO2_12_FULL_44_22]